MHDAVVCRGRRWPSVHGALPCTDDVTVPCLQLRLQLNEFVVEVLVVLHVVTTQSARTISRHKDDTRNAAGNITIADACCYSVIQAVR